MNEYISMITWIGAGVIADLLAMIMMFFSYITDENTAMHKKMKEAEKVNQGIAEKKKVQINNE